MSEGEKGGTETPREVARWLLNIGAVTFSPRILYTWASGIKSPIYCDCRRIMSFPEARKAIEGSWARLIKKRWANVQTLVGVAMGGIPHAAFVAEELGLPMAYVRSSGKSHGLERRIEGVLEPGTPVVVMEDLVSTGSSLIQAVQTVAREGARVLGATAIFTYDLPAAVQAFKKDELSFFALTSFPVVRELAEKSGALSQEDLKLLDTTMERVREGLRSRGL